jgi:glycosyltransferase involved in cell wall biosynthesis
LAVTNLPALLLLSIEGPNLSTAGGITLHRLLSEYPADRLRVIEWKADPRRGQLNCTYHSLSAPLTRLEYSRFHRLKRSLSAIGLVPGISPRRVDAALRGFRPEIVLCVTQSAAYYRSAYRYARSRGLPLVLIAHDVNDGFEGIYGFAEKSARRRDRDVYRYAARRLCVSQELERLNAELYGVSGEVMYPNRCEQLRPRALGEAAALKVPSRLSVGFVGNVNSYGYGQQLERLLPAFRATASRLLIFGHPPGARLMALRQAADCCDILGFAPTPEEAWRRAKDSCDAVILPYLHPTDAHWGGMYRCHFPSKLPEYLAVGLPVIVTGPADATGMKWALRHPEAAASYSGTDWDGVAAILSSLRDNPGRRLALVKAAGDQGAADFDPVAIKRHFLAALADAAHVDQCS